MTASMKKRKRLSIRLRGERDYIVADSAADLVSILHNTSRAPAPTDRDWMREAAHRARVLSNARIRFDTARHFVSDCIAAYIFIRKRHKALDH